VAVCADGEPLPEWFCACDTSLPRPWDPGVKSGRGIPVVMADFEDLPGQVSPEALEERLFGEGPGSVNDYLRWTHQAPLRGWVVRGPREGWFSVGRRGDFPGTSAGRRAFAEAALAAAADSLDLQEAEATWVVVLFPDCGAPGPGRTFRPGVVTLLEGGPGPGTVAALLLPELWREGFQSEECAVRLPLSIFCHEALHLLGYPDLHVGRLCGEDSGQWPMLGRWDIMDTGAWGAGYERHGLEGRYDVAHPVQLSPATLLAAGGARGKRPAGMARVERSGFYPLPAYEESPVSLLVPLREDPLEAFVVARYAAAGYQATLPAAGVMIWHVDLGRDTRGPPWRLALEQADGECRLDRAPHPDYGGDAGDPWPGATGRLVFGPRTRVPQGPPWSERNPPDCLAYGSPCTAPGEATGITIRVVPDTTGRPMGVWIDLFDPASFSLEPPPLVSPRSGMELPEGAVRLTVGRAPRPHAALAYAYVFEVATDSSFADSTRVAAAEVAEAGERTSWTTPHLVPGRYWWRVATRADSVQSPWATASLRILGTPRGLLTSREGSSLGEALCAGDWDGDGRDDLAVSFWPSPTQGGVRIVFGMPRDRFLRHEEVEGLETLVLTPPLDSPPTYGVRLASGDLNGDGVDDLVIGMTHRGSRGEAAGGTVYLLWGGRPRQSWPADLANADVRLEQPRTGFVLPSALGIGDLDGDGFDDLLVARVAPAGTEWEETTHVFVFRGGPGEPLPRRVDLDAGLPAAAVLRSRSFRTEGDIVLGRFVRRGQAWADLVLTSRGAGALLLPGRRWEGVVDLEAEAIPLFGEAGWRLGPRAAVADLDADGLDDLLIAAWFEPRVFVWRGREAAELPAAVRLPRDAASVLRGREPGSVGSMALAVGEWSGDRLPDVALGCELAEPGGLAYQGAVPVFFGRIPLPESLGVGVSEGTVEETVAFPSANLGHALVRADVDGDGRDDLVASAPGLGQHRGGLLLLFGPLGDYDGGLPGPPAAPGPDLWVRVEPNPSLGPTRIRYGIPGEGPLRVDVLDPLGRRVRTLLRGSTREATGWLEWDGRDGRGRRCASGLYWVRLRAAGGTVAASVLLLRGGR
jgi:hypothetical protein